MKLLDVNILVHAHRKDAVDHARYYRWLLDALEGQERLAVSELVLSGFIRIVTHPRIFRPPSDLTRAFAFTQEVKDHPNVTILSPGSKHWEIFHRLCLRGEATGNRVPDAYHAALAMETGCEWISADRGFSRYPGLKWSHPLNTP